MDQLQQQQPAVASPGPELVLAWVDNTFHNLRQRKVVTSNIQEQYESIATVGEIRVWWRANFQSGSRVLKKVF